MQYEGRRVAVVVALAALLYGPSRALAQSAPSLGNAASFAVLGGNAVTNSGPTVVTGNLGVSPGNTVTGFGSGSGTVRVGDVFSNTALAQAAQHDAFAAYNALADSACTATISGLLSGSLSRGVYCLSSPAQLTGTLTLNGDASAVWIFQIPGTLTTDPDSNVLVINGGKAGNVFWRVGTSATLGAGSFFQGNLLTPGSITLQGGAIVSGRLLSLNGAVALNADSVSLCCDPLNLDPIALSGAVGVEYRQTIKASGGLAPYTFRLLTGALPYGLSPLTPSGVLSGVPSKVGSFPFTVIVTDFHGCSGTREYTINIPCQTITVTNPTTATGTSCAPFSQQFMQTGAIGGVTFSLAPSSGPLPRGLMLTNGLLHGTPTQTGTFPIIVMVTDGNGCTGAGPTYNLIINCPQIVVINPVTATGTAGMSFSQTFTQTGSLCASTFSLDTGMLPAGLTLYANGNLAGVPTQTGTFTITVKATDRSGCFATGMPYTLVIGCQTIIVRNPVNAIGTVGVPFSELFTQRGAIGNATFTTLGPLPTGAPPAGFTLSGNGTLSGTPTQSGSFPIKVTVTDANNCTGTSPVYPLIINPAPCVLTLSPAALPGAAPGIPYSETITASGGTAPYTFSVSPPGPFPVPGLSLNATTGEISGIPTTLGVFNFIIVATDTNGCRGFGNYTIVVAAGGPTLSVWGILVLSVLLVGAGVVMIPTEGMS